MWWATWERRACRQVPWQICSLRRSWRTELKCAPLKVWLCALCKIFTHPPGLLILQCWRPPGTTVGKHLTFNFYFLTFRMGINQRTDFTELCWSGRIRNVPGKWRGFERCATPQTLVPTCWEIHLPRNSGSVSSSVSSRYCQSRKLGAGKWGEKGFVMLVVGFLEQMFLF